MKRKELVKRCLLVLCLSVSLVSSSVTVCYGAPESGTEEESRKAAAENTEQENGEAAAESTEQENGDIVEINSLEDFLDFAENCRYDNWSLGRTISLTTDLDLAGADFEGIAYFGGVFEGNGHNITNVKLSPKGSDYGFFRYIGETGEVKNINVSGTVKPSGSQENIGGLVGVNRGIVRNCSFVGNVNGINAVGVVAGINKSTGSIVSCSSNAIVLGTNDTGGIVGTNEGVVTDCTSKSSVNIEALEPTLDFEGVDLSSLNLTQNIINRNDMGGIAGNSSGIIMNCKNTGTVGYQHTGYNVGGIAGSQSGIVLNSTNEGKIYGRKDVGGIAGQAEPYVESEYLEDKVRQTQEDVNRLNSTLNQISSTMSATSADVRRYTENLNNQYTTSRNNITGNLNALKDAAAREDSKIQGCVDNISSAWDNIESIRPSWEGFTEEQISEIQNNLGVINDSLGSLQGSYADAGKSAEELKTSISNELQNAQDKNPTEDITNLADAVDDGVQSITNSMNSMVSQMNKITNTITEDLSVLAGEEEVIEDISSLKTAENMNGVISGCVNYGEINGDLNAGGIAGTMNIEYDGDPEFDLDLTESVNITLRSTVNDVMIHCVNYGTVTAKKNCAGGITGLQELGFIYDCEGYGAVKSNSGNYLGGIVGDSAGTIEKSYSHCNISGRDYVGGICGNGYSIKDSISVSDIESDGEWVGSVAGHLEEAGTVKGNFFVNDEVHGIDNISYAGMADRVSYEEVMAMEDIPEGFQRVNIVFETEDGILAEKQIAYGGNISEADFPDVPEKEGCYVEWPKIETLTDIKKDLTITAEYIPWVESVASTEESEDGKPIILAAGEFYEGTRLGLEKAAGPEMPDSEAVLAYAYSWKLSSEREKPFETLEVHLLIPEGAEIVNVWVQKDGSWTQVKTQPDGSYLVAELPYGADFAVMTQAAEDNRYLIIVGAGVLLVAVILIWRSRKNKAGKIDRKK